MKLRYKGKVYNIFLVDSGTLDTEIEVDGKRHTFSQDYAATFRKRNGEMTEKGLKELAREAIEDERDLV